MEFGDWTRIVELGLVIGKTGRDIKQADAHSYISGYSACPLFSLPTARYSKAISPRSRHDRT